MTFNRILTTATLLVMLSVAALAQTPNDVDLTPLTAAPAKFRDLKGAPIAVGANPTIPGGLIERCNQQNLPKDYGCFVLDKAVRGYSESPDYIKPGSFVWVYGDLPAGTLVIVHLPSQKIARVVVCGNRFYHEIPLKLNNPEPEKPQVKPTPCPELPPPCVPFAEPKVTKAKDDKGNEVTTIDRGCGVIEKHVTKVVCEGGYNDLVEPTRNGKTKSFKVKDVLVPSNDLPQELINAIWEEMKKDKDVQKRFVKSDDDEKNYNRLLDSKIVFMHIQDSYCDPGKKIRVEILWDSWHWKEFWIGFAVGVPVGAVVGHYTWPKEVMKTPKKDSTSGGVRTVPNGDPVRGPIAPRDGIRTIESPLGSNTTGGDMPIGRTIGGAPPINPATGGGSSGVPVRLP